MGKVTGRWLGVMAVALVSLGATAAEPILIALSKAPVNLPLHVADAEGLFAAEGVAVQLNEVTSSVRAMELLAEGKADLVTGSETLVMFHSFKRNDFGILASFTTSTEDQKVVAHAQSGITQARHLANKRVGTILGSASHYYLDTLALLHNVDPRSITVVGLQPDTIVGALQRREVDAIAMWQPHPFRAQREIAGAKVLPDGGFHTLSFNLIASRKIVDNRSDDLVKVLRALDKATRLIATKPQTVKAILRSGMQLDDAYAEWVMPNYRYQLTLDQSLLASLESEARWAREEGHVKARQSPNYLSFIYSAPLRRVRPSAVSIAE